MIEKLKVIEQQVGSLYDLGNIKTEKIFATNEQLHNKVNELIDAVNNLQISNAHIQKDLFEKRHPEAKVDPYAEQRKWIGKLCWFWSREDKLDMFVDILGGIDEKNNELFLLDDKICRYKYCKPVSPSDDIIYK